MQALREFFGTGFMPHGHCYLWRPELLWAHVGSDLLIALAYYSIPLTLVFLVQRRRDISFGWVFWMFGAFIFLCGTTHIFQIWTVWEPIYGAEALLKMATAGVSVATAVAIWPLVPKLLALPSLASLEAANQELRREIGERENVERRLRAANRSLELSNAEVDAAQRLFRQLLESAPDAMVIVDDEGRVVLVNAQTEKLFGWPREELLGRSVESLVPESSREAHPGHRRQFFQENEARSMGAGRQLYALRRDGTRFPAEIGLSHIQTREERLVAAAIRDVSERAEAENRLRTLNEGLEQFAYVVSHDLKAPMRGISTLTEWIAQDYGDALDDEGREQLQLLRERARRVHNLIEGILQYSRAVTGHEPRPVDVAATVREVVDTLAPPDEVEVRIGELPFVRYDEVQLAQVFQNLIGNAVQHREGPVRIEVGARQTEDGFEFHVKDDGPGIGKEHHERVFRMFQRLGDPGASSTGIGLAIVKRIVEANGGEIRLDSAPGAGARFAFTVPARGV